MIEGNRRMNSKERVLTALKRREPDRLPTFEWDIDKSVIHALCPGGSSFDFVKSMGLDAVVVSPNYQLAKIGKNLYRDEWGVVRKKGHESYLIPLEDKAPIRTRADFFRYKPPDPITPNRFDNLIKAIEQFKGEKAIIIKIRDAFSTPRDLMGYTNLLMNVKLDPQFVKELADLSIKHYLVVGLEAIKLGADIIVTGDDYCDNLGPLMSPKSFKECFLPGFKKMVNQIKKAGAYFIKHTDGNIMPLIDMFIETGIDCIDPIDPIAGLNIVKIKNKYGGIAAIKGNINCAATLSNCSIKEVQKEVIECIMKVSPGGGHIISSSNSIHSGVKPENYKAMLETIHEHGTYPIDVDRLYKEIGILKK